MEVHTDCILYFIFIKYWMFLFVFQVISHWLKYVFSMIMDGKTNLIEPTHYIFYFGLFEYLFNYNGLTGNVSGENKVMMSK